MHGLPILFIFAVIAFFVIRGMFFSGKRAVAVPVRRTAGPYATAADDDDGLRELEEIERDEQRRRSGGAVAPANPFESMGLPKGFGGMVGALASAAAVGAITSIVSDGEGSGEAFAEIQSRLRDTVAQAKRSGQPLDIKSVIAEVANVAEKAAPASSRANRPAGAAHRAPSGDAFGSVLGVRPPLDARPPLVPMKALARLHPVKVLAERAPFSPQPN